MNGLNRYDGFLQNDEYIFIPDFEIINRATDEVKRWNRDAYRSLPQLAYEVYNNPHDAFFIKVANQEYGLDEYEWDNDILIRIPRPILVVRREYFQKKDEYLNKIRNNG